MITKDEIERLRRLEAALRACDVNVPDLREHVYSVVAAALAGEGGG